MRLHHLLSAALLACVSLTCSATPTVLTPGDFTYDLEPGTVGSNLLNSVSGKTGPNGDVSYIDSVYSAAENPFCANCLAFVIAVTPGTPSTGVRGVSTTDFGEGRYQIAVAYLDGPSDAPVFAQYNEEGEISFDFGDQANDGHASPDPDALVIYTDAMSYDEKGGVSVSTETFVSDPKAFQPSGAPVTAAVTPEPSSLVLLGTGCLGVAGIVRRRLA